MCACGSPAIGASKQIRLAAGAVLHVKRGPSGVMAKTDPSYYAWVGSILAACPLPGPSEYLGDVTHSGVVGAIDAVLDSGALGRSSGELSR